MGWFGSNNINQQVSLQEGTHKLWSFTLNNTALVNLTVQTTDGYGPNIYVVSDKEYRNYIKGNIFKYITQLSYEQTGHLDGYASLPKGRWWIIAQLPRISDGMESYSEFSIRFEEVQ